MRARTQLIRYIRVGRLLHLIAICDVLLVILGFELLLDPGVDLGWQLLGLSFIIMFPIQFLAAELDSFSRFQNYKQIKDQVYLNGYQDRIIKPMSKSRCQRDAALVACRELGHEDEVRKYYRSMGYKWYHIPPDFVYRHPQFFFSKYFWRSTFFVPYYKPRVDFNKLDERELLSRTQILTIDASAG